MKFKISEAPRVYKEFLTYLQTIKSKSEATISEYASDLNIFFKFMKMNFNLTNEKELNNIEIKDLDIDFVKRIKLTDIYEYLSYMSTERNNSASTRSRKVACLRSYFKYMTNKAKYLDDNPAKDLESPKIKQSLPKYLSLEESKKLLNSVPKDENFARNYAIITLFLNCGMRLPNGGSSTLLLRHQRMLHTRSRSSSDTSMSTRRRGVTACVVR